MFLELWNDAVVRVRFEPAAAGFRGKAAYPLEGCYVVGKAGS